jgi:DNA-binding transcriptional ArsR family regulator
MSKKRIERGITGAALLFAALGDSTRLSLLHTLSADGPASITSLAGSHTAMTRQGLTKHLHVLKVAGVVHSERLGREHVWTLNPERFAEATRRLDAIAREWDRSLAALKAHVERNG